jgi:hypothetical protein
MASGFRHGEGTAGIRGGPALPLALLRTRTLQRR